MPAAATIGCYHTCPAYDGDRAHTGGPILQGSPNIFLGGKNACRSGDVLHCNSSNPDLVSGGSARVFINGLPAARMGDPTAHGGGIAEGSTNVFIG